MIVHSGSDAMPPGEQGPARLYIVALVLSNLRGENIRNGEPSYSI